MKGKVAIVTGGSRGIGFAIAQALTREGAKVCICGRTDQSLQSAVQKLGQGNPGAVHGIVADVSRYADCGNLVQATVEHFGGLDLLVNNAGVGHVYKPADQITPQVWDATLATNLSGTFYCSREAIPVMRRAGAGYIVNISSIASFVRWPGGSAYNASKSGLTGLTETLVKDVRYDGIRVSEIAIGSVSTEDRGYEHWKLAVEDVAGLVVYLCKMPATALVSRVELWPAQPPPNR